MLQCPFPVLVCCAQCTTEQKRNAQRKWGGKKKSRLSSSPLSFSLKKKSPFYLRFVPASLSATVGKETSSEKASSLPPPPFDKAGQRKRGGGLKLHTLCLVVPLMYFFLFLELFLKWEARLGCDDDWQGYKKIASVVSLEGKVLETLFVGPYLQIPFPPLLLPFGQSHVSAFSEQEPKVGSSLLSFALVRHKTFKTHHSLFVFLRSRTEKSPP